MKRSFLIYAILSITYTIITEITNNLLNLNGLIRQYLIDIITVREIDRYFEFQDKWHWLTYLFIPALILLKTSITTLILYIGLFLSSKDVKYKIIFDLVLKAEFIFLLVPIFKTFWFLLFQTTYDLSDLQNFFPLSAVNITGYKNLESWFIYPFQIVNLFELSYIIYLAFQIGKLTNTNTDYGLKIVGLSYVPTLFLWVATVMFFTLNYS